MMGLFPELGAPALPRIIFFFETNWTQNNCEATHDPEFSHPRSGVFRVKGYFPTFCYLPESWSPMVCWPPLLDPPSWPPTKLAPLVLARLALCTTIVWSTREAGLPCPSFASPPLLTVDPRPFVCISSHLAAEPVRSAWTLGFTAMLPGIHCPPLHGRMAVWPTFAPESGPSISPAQQPTRALSYWDRFPWHQEVSLI